MAIIFFDEGEVIDYIPESERNEDEPAVIGIKYVPNRKTNYYVDEWNKKESRTKNPEISRRIPQVMQKRQFIENVEYVKGFHLGGKEIIDIEEFYKLAPSALITEIIRAMEDSRKLSEGQRKNLSGVSASDSNQAKTEAPLNAKAVPSGTGKPEIVGTGEDSTTYRAQ